MLKGLNLKCNIHTKRAMKTWQRNEEGKNKKNLLVLRFSPLKMVLSDRSTSFLKREEGKRFVLVMHARHVK